MQLQPYVHVTGVEGGLDAFLAGDGVEPLGRCGGVAAFTTAALRGWARGQSAEALLAAVCKVAVDDTDASALLFTNPEYWAAAYAPDADPAAFVAARELLSRAAGAGAVEGYGHEKGGLPRDKLRRYQYMMGMPRLEDQLVVGNKHTSHAEALRAVHHSAGERLVFTLSASDDSGPTVVGLSLPDVEPTFLPVLRAAAPLSHAPAMPYEVLVDANGEVRALHGRFRLALSWPSLTMATFGKIRKAPGAIEDALRAICSQPAPPADDQKEEEKKHNNVQVGDEQGDEKEEEGEGEAKKGQRVLSLDGGGTRGAAVILAHLGEIERRTGRRVADLFDLIVGSSIGGFIAVCLGVYGMSIVETKAFVFDTLLDVVKAEKTRVRETLLSSKAFDAALKEHLFETEHDSCRVAVLCSRVVDKGARKVEPFWFTNFGSNNDSIRNLRDAAELDWWRAARASMAAPGFFKPQTIFGHTLLDGGLVANDASALAVRAFVTDDEPTDLLLSLGPGTSWEFDERLREHLSAVPFGKQFIAVFEHARVGHDRALDALLPSTTLARWNPELPEPVPINEASPAVLRGVESECRRLLRADADAMDVIVRLGGRAPRARLKQPAPADEERTAPAPAAADDAKEAVPVCSERVREWYMRARGDSGAVQWLEPEDGLCMLCKTGFGWFRWRHHCRSCGALVCGACSPHVDSAGQRVCTPCKSFAEKKME